MAEIIYWLAPLLVLIVGIGGLWYELRRSRPRAPPGRRYQAPPQRNPAQRDPSKGASE